MSHYPLSAYLFPLGEDCSDANRGIETTTGVWRRGCADEM